jgi:hypothetical protein
VEWFLALLVFSCAASTEGYGYTYYGGYSNIGSSFQFLVSTGVLIWLWVMVFALPATYSMLVTPVPGYRAIQLGHLQMILLSVDAVWILFCFASAVSAAVSAHKVNF